MLKFACIATSLLGFLSGTVYADDRAFEWSAFGTLGVVTTDSNRLGYRNDHSQEDGVYKGDIDWRNSSKLGVQLNYQVSSTLDVVGQWLYREQREHTLDTLTSMAFVRYRVNDQWRIRVGRTALDLFMLTEYRDVNFAYPWAKAPTEVYGLIPHRHLDGVDVVYETPMESFNLRAKLYTGKSFGSLAGETAYTDVELNNLVGLSLEAYSFDWLLTAKWTQSDINETTDSIRQVSHLVTQLEPIWPSAPQFASALKADGFEGDYISLGGRYDGNQWSFYGELARMDSDSSVLRTINNGYISGVYHWHEAQLFAGAAYTHTKAFHYDPFSFLNIAPRMSSPNTQALLAAIEGTMFFFAPDQETVFAGVRYNYTENIALTFQVDVTEVSTKGDTLWQFASGNGAALPNNETVTSVFSNLSFAF